ncbi:MAG: DUF1592 domain-containing protein [Akkermansiaceae bacterium]|nr:DUF1592 domain-containing protein [Akkermansiaceae bacterium]MCP5549444.1 DUF1592 domain-containing protein [Akkermansiaceae bacterium]
MKTIFSRFFPLRRRLDAVLRVSALAFGLAGIGAGQEPATPDLSKHPGLPIYKKLCLECHGETGEGVEDKADEPLQGDRDTAWLAGRIERTMPEDKEDQCVGDDAKAVADYIFLAFYSPEAQARLHPARATFSRLTSVQYQNSVTDLVGAFRGGHSRSLGPDRGLKGYYDGTFKKKNDRDKPKAGDKFERVEGPVKFDFGDGVPATPEGKTLFPEQFSIRWEGSLLAQETGAYEFVLRTRNGAMLWVNNRGDEERVLIDAYVAANNEWREHRATLFLSGGRAYPLKLDYFKYLEKGGGVELWWKPPHGVLEPIPKRCLSPERVPESLLVTTPFPADDRSTGYERGIAVSKAWHEAVTAASMEAADYVVEHIDELAGTKKDAPDRAKKIGDFGVRFVETAFRRPLTGEERARCVDKQFKEAGSLEKAVKRLVLLTLNSPRFLFPEMTDTGAPSPGFGTASRLALALWDSIPDRNLLDAARKGELKDPKRVESQARRMLNDPRAREKLRGFFYRWLELERADDLSKDEKTFPGFDAATLADLRTSLWLFLDDAVWSEKSDYRHLLLADSLFLNERLGTFYGKQVPPDAGFQRISFDPNQRAGLITHPFLLSTLAYHNSTSPIHRGVFLTRNIVGMTLKSPVEANKFDDSKFDPSLTMREKVTVMTRSQACMGCHHTINPLGFSLENYDGVGRWQTRDRDKPIDTKSVFETDEGEKLQLKGARDVANFAANSRTAHRTFIHQLFHHVAKQPLEAYGFHEVEHLRGQFEKSGYSLRELLVKAALVAVRDPGEAMAATGKPQPPAPKTAAVTK